MSAPCSRIAAAALVALHPSAGAFDSFEVQQWSLTPVIEQRFGLQYGTGINFGAGAADAPDERQRGSASLSLEPSLRAERPLAGGTFYSSVSVVAATNVLDGEVSGQFARSGDSRIDINEGHVGWRNERIDISVGPQTLLVGDGLVIADGNFDEGRGQGQYWIAPFDAWKNAAVLKLNGAHLRSDWFWLNSGGGFGDAELYGVNIESVSTEYGRFGAMYLDVFTADALDYDGIEAWNLRALGVPMPGLAAFKLYGEVVLQRGRDVDNGGVDNRGLGWYLEGGYTLPKVPWSTELSYRYSRFSGDDPATEANETYRSLFYGFGSRGWDAFYQGEIAGEFHLFNSDQITQFIKLRTSPNEKFALIFYYYMHDLEEQNYLGTPVSNRDWADEINAGIEYLHGHDIYIYAGIAWSSPNTAAREVFGDDEDFTVVQTWMMFRY